VLFFTLIFCVAPCFVSLPWFLCCSLFCSFKLFICIASVVGLSHCWFAILLVLRVHYIVFGVVGSSCCFYCWFVTTFATIDVLCCLFFVLLTLLLVMLLIPRYSSKPPNYCSFVLLLCIDGCYSCVLVRYYPINITLQLTN